MVEVFKKILKTQIASSNIPLYIKSINYKLIKRIKDTNDKFNYLKFIISQEKLLYNFVEILFYKSQHTYLTLLNYIKIYRIRKAKIYNLYDLNYEKIDTNQIVFNIYYNRFIYKFTKYDFINIINFGIFNYQDIINNTDINNTDINTELENFEIILQYNPIKNPYTNLVLDKAIFYNFYNHLRFNNQSIPLILHLMYKYDFNIYNLYIDNSNYIISETFKIYTKNLNKQIKEKYIRHIVKLTSVFLFKYVNITHLKYNITTQILDDNKDKFITIYNINSTIYNKYIYYFLITLYYNKLGNLRSSLLYKFRLVFEIIADENINFLKNYLKYQNTNISILLIMKNNINLIFDNEITGQEINLNNNFIYNPININNYINKLFNEIYNHQEFLNKYGIYLDISIIILCKNYVYTIIYKFLNKYYIYYKTYYEIIILIPIILSFLNIMLFFRLLFISIKF